MKSASLWRISLRTSPKTEEALIELLQRSLAQPAFAYTDFETGVTTVGAYLEPADWSMARRDRLKAELRKMRRCGLNIGAAKISSQRIRREDWAESWKRHFKPIQIGSALLIKPSWSARPPRKNQAAVVLDPGLSFGTGQHPTTRFCLEQLVSRRAGKKQSFWDLGTGSGILAIAAAKLGYEPIEALDCDPDAIRIARANARRNGVARKIRLVCEDLARSPITAERNYDVIGANLTADLLLHHKRRILSRLQPGGTLVVAGALQSEFRAIEKAYEESGLELMKSKAVKGWKSGAFVNRA